MLLDVLGISKIRDVHQAVEQRVATLRDATTRLEEMNARVNDADLNEEHSE